VNIADIVFKPFKILYKIIDFIFSEGVFPIILVCIVIFLIVGLVSAIIQGFITEEDPATLLDMFVVLLKAWIIPGSAIIVSALAYKPINWLFSIRVAKCPLKEIPESRQEEREGE